MTKCPMCGCIEVETLSNKQMRCKKCNCIFYIPERENNIELEGGEENE